MNRAGRPRKPSAADNGENGNEKETIVDARDKTWTRHNF
jgi:hypothetical protein